MEHFVDIENIMAISTIEQAKELLKDAFSSMTLVSRWKPFDGQEEGITFQPKMRKYKKSFSSDRKLLKPIIKDVNVTWFYSENKIKTAVKILSLLGWNNPEFYCPTSAYPMMIKTGKRFNNTDKEPVILIAPRIESE